MSADTERIAAEIERLPDYLQREVLDFIQYLQFRAVQTRSETILLSEDILAEDWLSSEEEAAWQNL